jgi:hypothetical protein
MPKFNDGGYVERLHVQRFIDLAESYSWLNPLLTLRVSWNGEEKIDAKASNPTWSKWLPSWPTSAHWYDRSHFRRYMAAHIAHRGSITVREFVSEFAGMSATHALFSDIGWKLKREEMLSSPKQACD